MTIVFAGQDIVGISESVTVTLCVHNAELPELSVTVHVTIVVPTKNDVGALLVVVNTEQLSEVIGRPSAILDALQAEGVVVTFTLDGHDMTGF